MVYKPSVGDSGKFTLLSPFSQYLTPEAIYTCRSIRTINDIVASGEPVYERYYKLADISETKFKLDAANNVCIIGLQAGTGEWIYVPETYISEAPTSNGIKYIPVVIGVNIGSIPIDLDIKPLMKMLADVSQSSLGIEPQVKPVIMTQPALISNEDHIRLNIARQANITNKKTDFLKAIELNNENIRLKAQIKALEEYIRKRT